jgi:hypothetical protein
MLFMGRKFTATTIKYSGLEQFRGLGERRR